MKNKIIMITVIVSIVLVICLAVFGLKIGNFEIPSISKIIAKNNDVNSDIEELTQMTSSKYPEEIQKLETTIDSLNVQKEKYEQISGLSADAVDTNIYETEKYDIGYLWTTLGKYASKTKIGLAMDVKKSSGTDVYDLYFTVQGEYTDISTLITKLENDSDLSFRIYDFKLVPGSSDVNLKATFVVKNINIDSSTLIQQTSSVLDDKGTLENLNMTTDNTTTNNSAENNVENNADNTVE